MNSVITHSRATFLIRDKIINYMEACNNMKSSSLMGNLTTLKNRNKDPIALFQMKKRSMIEEISKMRCFR